MKSCWGLCDPVLKYSSFTFVSQKRDFRKETDSVLTSVRVLLDDHAQTEGDSSLQVRHFHILNFTVSISLAITLSVLTTE